MVEFKKTNESSNHESENQVAAASALWLYQRVQLRRDSLKAQKVSRTIGHFTDIKHYATIPAHARQQRRVLISAQSIPGFDSAIALS
jgi:hypothetical protein